MININIVCVDNLASVNRNQLKSFTSILKRESTDARIKEDLYKILDESEDSFKVVFSCSKELSFNFINETLVENETKPEAYKKYAIDFINRYYTDGVDGLLFIVDLCLDEPENTEFLTGQSLIQAIKEETNNKNIKTVACTGVNELDRLEMTECLLFHRRLSGENVFDNTFPAFDKSPEIINISKISDTDIKRFLGLFLSHRYRNTQYFGEILLEAFLFAS